MIEILKIYHKDITENGYFFTDKKDQKDYMLGLESLVRIMKLVTDNKHVQGDWRDVFDPIAERLRVENHWSEHAEFVRDYRYRILGDGTIKDRYKYTDSYILGKGIVPKINNVVLLFNLLNLTEL